MNGDVKIWSAENYFDYFGREGIGKNKMTKDQVREGLIRSFQNEVTGMVLARTGKDLKDIPIDGDGEDTRKAKQIVRDTVRKWQKVVNLFARYNETRGIISFNDLATVVGGGNSDPGEDVTDDPEYADVETVTEAEEEEKVFDGTVFTPTDSEEDA